MKAALRLWRIFLVVVASLNIAHGANLLWEASSGLTPDQVGYELVNSSSPEVPVLSSSVLTISNDSAPEVLSYRMSGPDLLFPDTIEVFFRMRYVSGSSSANGRAPAGVFITTAPNVGAILYIGSDEIFLDSGSISFRGPQNTNIDTDSSFHDYLLRIEGTVAGSVVSVFQDNQLVLSGVSFTSAASHGAVPRIAFGDGTSFAFGTSEWLSFGHNAYSPGSYWHRWKASFRLTPDQVGYELADSSSPENPVLSPSALTIGNDTAPEVLYYRMTEPEVHFTSTIEVSFRMRFVTGSSIYAGRSPAAVFVTTAPNVGASLWIGRDEIFLGSGNFTRRGPENTTIDTDSSFHDYLLRIEGTGAGSAVSVFQDNNLVLSGVSYTSASDHGGVRRIGFGELSGLAFGCSEWQSFAHNASAVPQPPIADASATLPLVISPNNTNATVVLNGTLSFDPGGDPLTSLWLDQSGTVVGTSVVSVTTLPVGTNEVSLLVDNGLASDTNSATVVVITLSTAADSLLEVVATSGTGSGQSLIASLRAALASIGRGNPISAINQLQAFQDKVLTRVAPADPELAADFIQQAQDIINTLAEGELGAKNLKALANQKTGTVAAEVQFSGSPGRIYIIEASKDMVNWQMIGVAKHNDAGHFEFEDPDAGAFPCRFYRVVTP